MASSYLIKLYSRLNKSLTLKIKKSLKKLGRKDLLEEIKRHHKEPSSITSKA